MTTATSQPTQAKRTLQPLNGVDTPALISTIKAVGANPDLAQFTFRNTNEWISGTHSRSTMHGFFGAGGEHTHKVAYTAEGDHPAVLCGTDNAPTPTEWVLHALAACLTAGIGNIAAARGVKLKRVKSTIEGNIDLRGILGLSDQVRNGYRRVTARFEIEGDAPPETLAAIVEQSRARSAVFDVLTRGVPVSVEVA
ncbi:MAG: OsmC family protein [Rhizomicrobium sp.]